MNFSIRCLLLACLWGWCLHAVAQGNTVKIDIKRQLFHDYIDREQKNILKWDGKADNFFKASEDDEINFLVTQAMTKRIDQLQHDIEMDTALDHGRKVANLRGIESMLKTFYSKLKTGRFNASYWPVVLDTYEKARKLDSKGESIEQLIAKTPYEVGNMVVSSGAFDKNRGIVAARHGLLKKFTHLHPEQTFMMLKEHPNLPFQDSLIRVAAYKHPMKLYDFAAANNKLGYAIRSIDDPLVKTISKMATSGGSGQIYFPFLDDLVKGKLTFADIDAVKNDDIKYYRLLVKTRIEYVNRAMQKDSVFGMKDLNVRLENKATGIFIRRINALHEEQDPVRFRILQQLNPQELYYLIVSGENEIYTSSYTRGVYPIMMAKIGNRGDSLLMSVGFDRFKKFIKMAAAYNTLNDFLKTFPNTAQAESLMTAFVNGLEKSTGLEDGVDVADSYVSIMEHNKPLANYVLNLTKINYDKNLEANNHRGTVMYNLLYKLFLSADTTNQIDLSSEFGIPPVYNVAYTSLANEKQQVVMQVFFYGDEDGRNNYAGFMRQFGGGNWKVEGNNQWATISSTKGKPVIIFANKPLKEETGDDEKAQNALTEYLHKQGLPPSIIIHRGHSYYAPYTISHVSPAAKIVFLGSCGGYHLIHDVLALSQDAHIIASKQIGKTVINQPFFNLLMEKLRNGNNIEWIPFWNEFKKTAGSVEGFSDYIPPHKNLGAIFIKAYTKRMGAQEDE
jgi:hypothetical protein